MQASRRQQECRHCSSHKQRSQLVQPRGVRQQARHPPPHNRRSSSRSICSWQQQERRQQQRQPLLTDIAWQGSCLLQCTLQASVAAACSCK